MTWRKFENFFLKKLLNIFSDEQNIIIFSSYMIWSLQKWPKIFRSEQCCGWIEHGPGLHGWLIQHNTEYTFRCSKHHDWLIKYSYFYSIHSSICSYCKSICKQVIKTAFKTQDKTLLSELSKHQTFEQLSTDCFQQKNISCCKFWWTESLLLISSIFVDDEPVDVPLVVDTESSST